MEGKEKIQELVSRYVDHEVTPDEQKLVEEYIRNSDEVRSYYQQLVKLNTLLTESPLEQISSDWEQKVISSIREEEAKGASAMKRGQPWVRIGVGSGVLVTLLVVLLSVNMYMRRGIQGRTREAADNIGMAYSPAPTTPSLKNVDDKWHAANLAGVSVSTASFQMAKKPELQEHEPYYLQSDFEGVGGIGGPLEEQKLAMIEGKIDESWRYNANFHTEEYDRIYENRFLEVAENPLSTFSIDVDTASYSNMRRFLTAGQLPPEDAVRIEELINYFTYDYPQPEGDQPFSITIDGATCPWNTAHQLARIGIKGKTYEAGTLPPSNLVFLIDVSGSMNDANKLPLLQSAFRVLTSRLSAQERVALVVYAGNAGKVLDSTPGNKKSDILAAIDQLRAGGSTAGGAGIKLAYQIAKENFIEGGNNRVILATDGDFNVGTSSDAELVRMIEEERTHGIFLTVLGFGMGNYKDSKMEKLADKGNGNYYYIDTKREAEKVLGRELGSTIFTIAKDVKIQIEFNPQQVKAYRLIGYENRVLAKEDFNDDTKDAGELGAGHTVTALYEIVPAGSTETFTEVDALTYQKTEAVASDDVMTVKLRYKEPDEDVSKLISQAIAAQQIQTGEPTGDLLYAVGVAEFGMLLRNSKHKGTASYEHVLKSAKAAQGTDAYGYREEFIELVRQAQKADTRDLSAGGIQFKE